MTLYALSVLVAVLLVQVGLLGLSLLLLRATGLIKHLPASIYKQP